MAKAKPRKGQLDSDALKMLKESGILHPDVTLEQLLDLSEKLDVVVEARRGFIFRDFIYRPC
jgi:hypothetical protein